MLEENILGACVVEARHAQAGGQLRALSWPEIVARLAAARDLRRILAGRLPKVKGSFAPLPAHRLAVREQAAREQGKPGVNPTGLGNGKAGKGMIFDIVAGRWLAS